MHQNLLMNFKQSKMKTQLLSLLLLFCLPAMAQKDKIRERIKAQRIAFITQRLALTPDEAQKFWPVYNQFSDELDGVKREMNKNRRTTNDNLATMTEKDIEKALELDLLNQQKVTDIQRKYQSELKRVIPARKIAMLYKAEHDFKLTLLKRMKDRGHQGPPPDDEL